MISNKHKNKQKIKNNKVNLKREKKSENEKTKEANDTKNGSRGKFEMVFKLYWFTPSKFFQNKRRIKIT